MTYRLLIAKSKLACTAGLMLIGSQSMAQGGGVPNLPLPLEENKRGYRFGNEYEVHFGGVYPCAILNLTRNIRAQIRVFIPVHEN